MSEAFVDLLGATLVAPNGSEVQTRTVLANKSVVGLYFSAHWCPPCRMFTPMLSEKFRTAYRGKGMEIVFVSSDRDEHSFKEYHQSMPWLALPFFSHQIKQNLSIKYGVSGIPCLIILDGKTAQVITMDGREQVMSDSSGSKFFGVTVAPSFPGSGQSLGASQPSVAVNTTAGASAVHIDRSKPVTSIQIRFPDGSKVTQEFNSSARCSDVVSFVSKSIGSTGGKRIKFVAGFPPKEIEDLDSTVMAAGIANSQVTVQLA